MPPKAPRRTAERIQEVTLELFNRFGEPNVPTGMICSELGISPGNLYYHYPSKDALVQALFEGYVRAINPLLKAGEQVGDVEDAWFFIHSLFECLWTHRFVYRDINDLLSNNRRLERDLQDILQRKLSAFAGAVRGLQRQGQLDLPDSGAHESIATSMVVVLTYWLSFEFVRDPRHAMEDARAQASLLRGAQQVLGLLAPYLRVHARQHLNELMRAYTPERQP